MIFKQTISSGIFKVSLLFLFLVTNQIVQAQEFSFKNFPEQNSSSAISENPVKGNLSIIAIMVEFQPDTNRFTSGNGTFDEGSIPYLENPGTNIDALPHNQAYFEAHLEFVKNYFEKMSDGRLNIEYQVLPEIYRLPKMMEEYSPIGQNPELNPLAQLAKDAWEEVQERGNQTIELNTFENTAFIIFHAGIGRDIELTGTILDRTPQDIPSVYLNQSAIGRLLNDPSFTGFPIDNGNVLVSNSLILPRTLSRAGEDITGNRIVLPLSINGMITAQIGSHLGLPDLFNTENGQSGIGRFGLMDGAGIFAYNGLFPPELSAFEKYWLGWSEPFTIEYDEPEIIELPASSFREPNSIAKVPISRDEYFLIENRHRDPDGNGVTLTIRRPDGTTVNQTFTNLDETFIFQQSGYDDLFEPGVVIDIDNYDFALPGGLDIGEDGISGTEDDRELNGGILIWHIDESVIRQKLTREGINNDPERRAVNLREADGAQDIGKPVSLGLFENPVNGSPFDFWWSGNNATVITQTGNITLYQNRFGPDTTPNNRSNSGAQSFFELYDFSDNQPVAEFRIREVNPFEEIYELHDSRDDLSVTTLTELSDEYWKRYPLSIFEYESDGNSGFLIPGRDGIQFYNPSDKQLSGPIIDIESLQQPVYIKNLNLFSVAQNPLQADNPTEVRLFSWDNTLISEEYSFESAPNRGFISLTEPSILDLDGIPFRYSLNENELIDAPDNIIQRSESKEQYLSALRNGSLELTFPGGTTSHPLFLSDNFERVHTGVIEYGIGKIDFYLLKDGKLLLFSEDSGYQQEIILAESDFIEWPAIADVSGDGLPDFLFVDHTRNHLSAVNKNGAFLNNFPIRPPGNVRFTGTPLISDINGNGALELIIIGQDSYSINLYAYNQNSELLEGFPLNVGAVLDQDHQPIHPTIIENYLGAVSHNGDLKVWQFPQLQNTLWASRYGNVANNKITGSVEESGETEIQFSLLNKEETYNWPNPAKNETMLRFQTSRPAEIQIKISTMSGRSIYDRTFQSRGGAPEEILINTSTWGSGAYFAMITAKSGGETERKLINIAIAK
jgi:hypothetical protein